MGGSSYAETNENGQTLTATPPKEPLPTNVDDAFKYGQDKAAKEAPKEPEAPAPEEPKVEGEKKEGE